MEQNAGGKGVTNKFSPKKPGFSSTVAKGGMGNNGKRGNAMSKPSFIKGPRQAQFAGPGGIGKP